MSPSGKEGPFEVVYSEAVALALRELIERAGDENLEAEVLAAYEIADAALHVRAREFGEPMYDLRVMKLQMRLAVVRPLIIDYAVHHEKPLVFLRSFRLLTTSGE